MRRQTPFDYDPLEHMKHLKSRGTTTLHQLSPYLAHIIPQKDSSGEYLASSIFEELDRNNTYVVNKVDFTGSQLLRYIRLFYFHNTSEYLSSQTSSPQFSAAVPIVLAAYKLQHGIQYSSWSKSDPCLKRFFGPQMQWLFDEQLVIPELSDQEVREFREQVLLERKTGTIKPATSYKFERSGEPNFDKLPKLLKMMLLQTWIFHPQIRHPNMITDPKNWDLLAPAREEFIVSQLLNKPQVGEDLPW